MKDNILKALFEPRRFQLLGMIAERGYCVKALAVKSGLTEACVCQHMKVLLEAGLVYKAKRGYYTHYCLCKDAFAKVIAEMKEILEAEQSSCGAGRKECDVKERVLCHVSKGGT